MDENSLARTRALDILKRLLERPFADTRRRLEGKAIAVGGPPAMRCARWNTARPIR